MTKPQAAFAVAVVLVSMACGGAPPDVPTGGDPVRIVSLAPALTEILFALGVGDRVVGVTTFCDYPPEARALPSVGGFVNPSVESVLALEPDIVLVSPAAGNRDAALAIRRAGARLEVVHAETLEDTFTAIERVGELSGVAERGRSLSREMRARIERVSDLVSGSEPVPVLFSIQLDPLIVAGAGTLPSQLVELAGGVNVVEAERYPMVGIEFVVSVSPEVIIQARMDIPPEGDASRESAETLTTRTAEAFWGRWPAIPAVTHGRLMIIDGTTALRAGPRVADAVETLARVLHPDVFADSGAREDDAS